MYRITDNQQQDHGQPPTGSRTTTNSSLYTHLSLIKLLTSGDRFSSEIYLKTYKIKQKSTSCFWISQTCPPNS